MQPTLNWQGKGGGVEIGTVIRVYFETVLPGVAIGKPSQLAGRVVADVQGRSGTNYPRCPVLSPSGTSFPPDAPSTLFEAAADSLASRSPLHNGVEVFILHTTDTVSKSAPYIVAGVPTSVSLFPVTNPVPDVGVPPPPLTDYLTRWVRDIIMKREYGLLSTEMVVSALGGFLSNHTGTDFRVQLNGPTDGVRFSKLGEASESLLLGNVTVTFLDVLVAKVNAMQAAQAAQHALISNLVATVAFLAPASSASADAVPLSNIAVAALPSATALLTAALEIVPVPATTSLLKSDIFNVSSIPKVV